MVRMGMECSVLYCSVKENFEGITDKECRVRASDAGWVFVPPYLECRCSDHARGYYKMKPFEEEN